MENYSILSALNLRNFLRELDIQTTASEGSAQKGTFPYLQEYSNHHKAPIYNCTGPHVHVRTLQQKKFNSIPRTPLVNLPKKLKSPGLSSNAAVPTWSSLIQKTKKVLNLSSKPPVHRIRTNSIKRRTCSYSFTQRGITPSPPENIQPNNAPYHSGLGKREKRKKDAYTSLLDNYTQM